MFKNVRPKNRVFVLVLMLLFAANFITRLETKAKTPDRETSKAWNFIQTFNKRNTETNNFYEFLQILANDANSGDRFGQTVLLEGDTLVVSTTYDDDLGMDSGSIYIFERNLGGPNQWGQAAKIYGSTTNVGDEFGVFFDLDGDTLVVGAYLDDPNGENSGSAYIFDRNQGGLNHWGEVKHLVSSDNSYRDRFGWRVAIDGDTVLVGAYQDDTACPTDFTCNSGAAYIFERNMGGANNWGEVKKITASDLARDDNFSWGLDLFQDTIIIGAPNDDDLGSESGSIYIFERDYGGTNNWGEWAKIIASDTAPGDHFGNAISIDLDTLLVAARYSDANGLNSGAAYVFERDFGGSNTWGEVKKLVGHDTAAGDVFGDLDVKIHGDWIGIGAPANDTAGVDAGAAYIFERNLGGTENWEELTQLTAADAQPGDAFGFVINFQGQEIVVGARFHDAQGGADQGAVYLFTNNLAPQAADDTGLAFTTDEDTPFTTGNILDNDTDPDGNPLTIISVNTTALTGLLTSNNDGTFNYDPDGQFDFLAASEQTLDTFTYTIADTYGLTATATVTLTILGVNDAPTLDSVLLNPTEIDENDAVILSGSFTDLDTNNAHTLIIAWRDGYTNTFALQPGAYNFLATHPYLDDNPSLTSSDLYTVTVSLADTFATVSDTLPLIVHNLPPLVNAGEDLTMTANTTTNFAGSFTDPGTLDTHTILWNFGDGANATESLTPLHFYALPNTYSVTLTITDDDGGFGLDTLLVHVTEPLPLNFNIFLPIIKNCLFWWECLQ